MAVSFALVSIGVLDLSYSYWSAEPWAAWLALWVAAWWFLRAGSQILLGTRRGDLVALAWFAALGVVHVVVAFKGP